VLSSAVVAVLVVELTVVGRTGATPEPVVVVVLAEPELDVDEEAGQ
jgi:hypothetical protein